MTATPAAVVMGRVIGAVVLRETRTRFGRSRLGYVWAVFEPLAHVLTFIALFTVLGRAVPAGDNLAVFLATGVVPWLLFNHAATRTIRAVDGNRALLHFPQVTALDLMLARILLEAATAILVFALLLAGIALVCGPYRVENPLAVIAALLSIAAFGGGAGLVNAALVTICDSWERIVSAALRPLYFVSGIFFTADAVPPEARRWLLLNPVLHGIEWVRSALFTGFDSVSADPGYLVAAAAVSLGLGLALERRVRQRVRLT